MSIPDDNDVSGFRDGCLNGFIQAWSGNATLEEQVKLRHTHGLPTIHIGRHCLTGGVRMDTSYHHMHTALKNTQKLVCDKR